jgi:hypothetical protein
MFSSTNFIWHVIVACSFNILCLKVLSAGHADGAQNINREDPILSKCLKITMQEVWYSSFWEGWYYIEQRGYLNGVRLRDMFATRYKRFMKEY